jgi:hypothetical protein
MTTTSKPKIPCTNRIILRAGLNGTMTIYTSSRIPQYLKGLVTRLNGKLFPLKDHNDEVREILTDCAKKFPNDFSNTSREWLLS